MNPSSHSPRIAALADDLRAGRPAALEEFWQNIRDTGSPLVEPFPGDTRTALVTFLHRPGREVSNVVVVCQLNNLDAIDNQMARLLDTDLWFKTYRVPADVRQVYWFSVDDSLVSWDEETDWSARSATWIRDPHNPRVVAETPPGSSLILPDTPPQPFSAVRPGVPKGDVSTNHIHGLILDGSREVWVYTPPRYSEDGEPYPLLLLFDGWADVHLIPTPTILDNLLAEQRIPPLVAVLVGNPSPAARQRDLACSLAFVQFLADDLLPWVHARYRVTRGPAETIVGGSSLGGLAATFAAFRRPDLFGNVLSQSGAYWWKPEDNADYEWLPRQIGRSARSPLRFYLDVGVLELGRRGQTSPTMLATNRGMRDLLRQKGYEVHYAEFSGGHDYYCWEGTLPQGLMALRGAGRRSEALR